MGGTFDPIHYGHLFLAEEARVRCGLREVIFFPNHQPAHKQGKQAFAAAETRYRLTEIAIADNLCFRASRIELDRLGPSYAFDTLRALQQEFGPDVELCFIVGADTIGEVLTWHRGAELFDLCRFIAGTRPGYSWDATRAAFTREQLAKIEFLEIPGLHISSRELRQRLAQGLPLRYLTPTAVIEEIQRWHLYSQTKEAIYLPEPKPSLGV